MARIPGCAWPNRGSSSARRRGPPRAATASSSSSDGAHRPVLQIALHTIRRAGTAVALGSSRADARRRDSRRLTAFGAPRRRHRRRAPRRRVAGRRAVGPAGREATIETFWCRPTGRWPTPGTCVLALAGSLVMVSHADARRRAACSSRCSRSPTGSPGVSLGRRLTPERASQNVVSRAAARPAPPLPAPAEPHRDDADVRLIVTANYDAGRTGPGLPRRAAPRRRPAPARWPPAAAHARLAGLAGARARLAAGRRGRAPGGAAGTPRSASLQLCPRAALVLALALLLELAGAPFGPAAGDNASGAAVAVALVRALDAAPPRRAARRARPAGRRRRRSALGLRRHLRARRRGCAPAQVRARDRRLRRRPAALVGQRRPAGAAALPGPPAGARRRAARAPGDDAPAGHRGRGSSPGAAGPARRAARAHDRLRSTTAAWRRAPTSRGDLAAERCTGPRWTGCWGSPSRSSTASTRELAPDARPRSARAARHRTSAGRT